MEDDTAKEDDQPSASKKESQRIASTHDVYNERRKYEERDDHASNSESFTSGSYSGRSRIEVTDARPEIPKPPLRKRVAKPAEKKKKKRGRRAGRVDKRRWSARRQGLRRAPKRRPRKERALSVSTIFTRLSSQSGSRTPGCKFCGHRCCRRRFEYKIRRAVRRRKIKSKEKKKRSRRKPLPNPEDLIRIDQGSKQIQVGSRSMMLSPLFINTNSNPVEVPEEKSLYCEITPEMIYDALRSLTMWKQAVLTTVILDHIQRHYPVNRDGGELQSELADKLRVAAVVGIVTCVCEDRWCLNCALQQNRVLSKTHVTRFWKVYADTMSPIRKRVEEGDATARQRERDNLRKRLAANDDSLNDFV